MNTAVEQDVASLRVGKLETVFAQQSVRLPAAKVSRLAHDGGNQPMAPELSSGAPRERERGWERREGGSQVRDRLHARICQFDFKIKAELQSPDIKNYSACLKSSC